MARYWTCQRRQNGKLCGKLNTLRRRYCELCGKPRPASVGKQPAHRQALDTLYDEYVRLAGGVEQCEICGAAPKARRLHRDHDHGTGNPRGLLCFRCNAALRPYMTAEWCRRAAHYLDRAVDRTRERTSGEKTA